MRNRDRAGSNATRTLTRHFLRRFLENDLVSPSTDIREAFSVTCAALASCGLFVTVLLSLKYLGPVVTPGRTSITALDDKFVFIAYSMTIMALVAVIEWEALALDERDASILGPQPVPARVLVRAKLRATGLLAGTLLIAVNLVPSILFPIFLVATLPVGVRGVATLFATHALTVLAAGACGFLMVMTIRELSQVLLGGALFRRVSTMLRAVLVVPLAICFLLVPIASSGVGRSWLEQHAPAHAVPPLWFLGMYETAAGHVIDTLPRQNIAPKLVPIENSATTAYRGYRPLLRSLAAVAVETLALLAAAVAVACAWNNRALPAPPARRRAARTRRRSWSRALGILLPAKPVSQAGVFLALQTLRKSDRHRAWIALSVAAASAVTIVILGGLDPRTLLDSQSVPVSVLAVQTVWLAAILIGFRHAMRIPADVGANSLFHLSWLGDERGYLSGVKLAALVGLVLPVIVLLYPLHALVLGPGPAAAHLVCGLLVGALALELIGITVRRLPFASAFVQPQNLQVMVPVSLIVGGSLIYGFAALERLALNDRDSTIALLLLLAVLGAVVRLMDRWRRRRPSTIEFEELPEGATQRFSLGG